MLSFYLILCIKFVLQNTSEESNEYGELTEEEELIKANLEGDTALPLELMENIISPWWFQEPFRSVQKA